LGGYCEICETPFRDGTKSVEILFDGDAYEMRICASHLPIGMQLGEKSENIFNTPE
jgi:hypothetical protein